MDLYCSKCGKKQENPNNNYCSECGEPLHKENTQIKTIDVKTNNTTKNDKKSTKKKVLICILVLIGIIYICSYDSNKDYSSDNSNSNKGAVNDNNEKEKPVEEYNGTTINEEKKVEKATENSKFDIEINAKDISEVYYNNKLDGNKKYFGKKIKTYGNFDSAEKGALTGWNVTFTTDGKYDYYCATFVSGEEKDFSKYNRGEKLVIYAKVDELIGSYINLKQCDIERE